MNDTVAVEPLKKKGLVNFVKENAGLFTVTGVLAAIFVYLNEFASKSSIYFEIYSLRIGAIFLFSSLLILSSTIVKESLKKENSLASKVFSLFLMITIICLIPYAWFNYREQMIHISKFFVFCLSLITGILIPLSMAWGYWMQKYNPQYPLLPSTASGVPFPAIIVVATITSFYDFNYAPFGSYNFLIISGLVIGASLVAFLFFIFEIIPTLTEFVEIKHT